MLIRSAVIDDSQTIARFNTLMARETENISLDPPTILAGVRAVLGDSTKGLYFVAEVDGKLVGQIMITYEWSDWRNGNIWWIQSVYVDAAHRRGGIFKALYQHVRERAMDTGAVALRLYVHHSNDRAQQVYRKLGMSMSEYKVMEELFTTAREGT